MSAYNPSYARPRKRTIRMPESKAMCLATAARYLGVTGEDLIQQAITEKLTAIYADMMTSG